MRRSWTRSSIMSPGWLTDECSAMIALNDKGLDVPISDRRKDGSEGVLQASARLGEGFRPLRPAMEWDILAFCRFFGYGVKLT